jgi:hypothetical protein
MADDTSLREEGGDMIQGVFTTAFGLSALSAAGLLGQITTWINGTFTSISTLSLSNGGALFYLGIIGLLVTNDDKLTDPADTAGKGFWIAMVYFSAIAWIPDIRNLVMGSAWGQYLTLAVGLITFAMINGETWFQDTNFRNLGGLRS